MILLHRFLSIIFVSLLGALPAAAEAQRLEVLFLGDNGHHDPLERSRVLK